jgi:hypothetical protein
MQTDCVMNLSYLLFVDIYVLYQLIVIKSKFSKYINNLVFSSRNCCCIYIYIYIYICHSRFCSLRKKKERFLLQADDDDDDVFCFLCFRLAVTNIVADFSSFHCYAFNRSLALHLACRFLILTILPCVCI